MRVDASTSPEVRAPLPAAARDHFVQFYEDDAVLVEMVGRYLRNGIESGVGAIMIATPEHRAAFLAHWEEQGFDAAAALERGQLLMLDAAETMAGFLVEGWPDAARFEQTVGALVGKQVRRFGDLVAFGEIVALLWKQGRPDAALQVEALWNALGAKHRFALYCAYPMRDCAASELSGAFRDVCDAHSHVVSDALRKPASEADELRELAQLRQRAAALEREIKMRNRVEQELARRDAELTDFLENAIVGMHRVGPDGTILWANRAEMEMLGYQPGEYIGRSIVDFHADKAGIKRILERLAQGETLREQQATLLCKDGSLRHVLLSSNALLEDGKLVSTRCVTRDISDRWLAQEALRERGAVLHLAMQGARMGYWTGDIQRETLRCSPELSSLLGLSGPIDWSLDAFVALMHPDDRRGFRQAYAASVEGRCDLMCEFRVRRDTSDWRWFEARGQAVYAEDGTATRFYGVCMDVTSRKREQQVLAHLAAVVDSAADAIVSKTLDGIVTSWNAGAQRIFGYEAAEMLGRPIMVLIPREHQHEEADILAKIRSGGRIEHYETTRVAKDGTRKRISLAVSPVRDAAGRIIGASKIAREIKER